MRSIQRTIPVLASLLSLLIGVTSLPLHAEQVTLSSEASFLRYNQNAGHLVAPDGFEPLPIGTVVEYSTEYANEVIANPNAHTRVISTREGVRRSQTPLMKVKVIKLPETAPLYLQGLQNREFYIDAPKVVAASPSLQQQPFETTSLQVRPQPASVMQTPVAADPNLGPSAVASAQLPQRRGRAYDARAFAAAISGNDEAFREAYADAYGNREVVEQTISEDEDLVDATEDEQSLGVPTPTFAQRSEHYIPDISLVPTPTFRPEPNEVTSSKDFIAPLCGCSGCRHTSDFSRSRKHPVLGYHRPHWGIDTAAPSGTPVYAPCDGKIKSSGRAGGYGNQVVVTCKIDGVNYDFSFSHLSSRSGTKTGQTVRQGAKVGAVGTTGTSTGNHLHFEIEVGGQKKDPAILLKKWGYDKNFSKKACPDIVTGKSSSRSGRSSQRNRTVN